ncbi:MAG: hypothetical protein IH961_04665 [Chloroflexi bacterium]|nr:hypothetical protein [Chloroflexota bacterium]
MRFGLVAGVEVGAGASIVVGAVVVAGTGASIAAGVDVGAVSVDVAGALESAPEELPHAMATTPRMAAAAITFLRLLQSVAL